MPSFLARTRLASLTALAVGLVVAGAAFGAAGDPLIIGEANDAGSSQTILLSNATGASFTLKTTTAFSGSTGIFGWASATTGATRGVYGRADSLTGAGVYASNTFNDPDAADLVLGGTAGQNNGVFSSDPAQPNGDLVGVSYDSIIWHLDHGADNPNSRLEVWNTAHQVIFGVDEDGTVTQAGTVESPAGDFAEMVAAAPGLAPGDVLVIGADGRLTRSTKAHQSSVAGVYSTKPAFLGSAASKKGKVPLAIVGIVPVKVTAANGAIKAGDLVTTSNLAGHAMRADDDAPRGSILGKALGSLKSGTGTIDVLLVLQ